MAAGFDLYFKRLSQEGANGLRERLNKIALLYGLKATRGPTAGKGNLADS